MTDTKHIRIKGDWTINGYIDNLDRWRQLDIVIVNGRAYNVDMDGRPDTHNPPIGIDADGALCLAGASVGFIPEDGEIERIGGAGLFKPV